MKDIVAVATLAIVLATLTAGQVAAAQQAGQRWKEPGGAFDVLIPNGWQDVREFVGGDALLAIGPSPDTPARRNRALPICSVAVQPVPARSNDQASLNQAVEARLAKLLEDLRATRTHETSNTLVEGVRVVHVDVDRLGAGSAKARFMQTMFMSPNGSGAILFTVGCGASGSAYVEADIADMRAFVSSLAFGTRVSQ